MNASIMLPGDRRFDSMSKMQILGYLFYSFVLSMSINTP